MALLTVLEKVTEEQKRAYIERMLEVMRKADELEGEALQRAMELTAELQERVLGRIHAALAKGADQGGKWNPFWLPRLRQAIDELAHEMAQRYGTEVGAFLPKSWMVGGELVDESLSAAAEHIGYTSPVGDLLPKVQTHEVGIAANWSPDLIQGMAQHTKDVIGKEIAASVLTGESPHVLSKRLAGQITTQGSPFNSVAYRAQLITRTETRRVQGLGAQRRMEQAVSRYPRLRMKKTLLVAEVNGWPCEECDAISKQGPWDVNDPDAPTVPIHPNCRCDMIPDVQGFDVPEPDEKPVDEERDASVSDSERVEEADVPFDPEKHPRGEGGRFGSTGGSDTNDGDDASKYAQHPSSARGFASVRNTKGGAYDKHPEAHEVETAQFAHGNNTVTVSGAWKGTREAVAIEEAVKVLRPEYLANLTEIRFTNDELYDSKGTPANALYNPVSKIISISRVGDNDWRTESLLGRLNARFTLLHELGHHVYNSHMEAADIDTWQSLQPARIPQGDVQEEWATQFGHFTAVRTTSKIGDFFVRFRR